MGGFAWVTLATNDSYSLGALVLAHSLKHAGTKHMLAVLVTPGVTNTMRQKLAGVFDLVQEVNVLDSKDEANLNLLKRPELGITFTKLHCWRLTQFDKCVFMDADTLVLQNADELFDREEFSAAPDVGWPDCFNSGVFVYKPSNETYDKLVQFALSKGSFDGGDQGLLNLYFSDWAHTDISRHLPFVYNMCSTACYSYLPAFKQFGTDVKIVHFIAATKPWLQYFNTETKQVQPAGDMAHLKEVLQKWWDIFCGLVHSNLNSEMHLPSGIEHNPIVVDHRDVWDPWEDYVPVCERTDNDHESRKHSHVTSHIINSPASRPEEPCVVPFKDSPVDNLDTPPVPSSHVHLVDSPLELPNALPVLPDDLSMPSDPSATSSKSPSSPHELVYIAETEDHQDGGLAGAFAQFNLGAPRPQGQSELEENLRRQSWETGHIDYMGRDSFDKIWSKISETIAAAPVEGAKEGAAAAKSTETSAAAKVEPEVKSEETSPAKEEVKDAVLAEAKPTAAAETPKVEEVKTDAAPDASKMEAVPENKAAEEVKAPDAAKVEIPNAEEQKIKTAKTEEAKLDVPKVQEVKTEAPKVEEVKAEVQKVDEVKTEVVKAEEVKPETPKAEDVKTDVPKTEEVKTETPKVEDGKPEAPKPEEVKTDAPKVEEVKAEAPTTEKAKPEVPKAEGPQTETIKVEEAKTDAPKVEEVKTETPKAEETKSEAPKVEEAPKAEEAKAEAPKPEEAKTEVPKAEEIKTEASKTEETKSEAPKAEEAPKPAAEVLKTETVETPKAEEVKLEVLKNEESKLEEIKADALKTEEAKGDAPKAEEPKVEAPKTEDVKPDAPKIDKAKPAEAPPVPETIKTAAAPVAVEAIETAPKTDVPATEPVSEAKPEEAAKVESTEVCQKVAPKEGEDPVAAVPAETPVGAKTAEEAPKVETAATPVTKVPGCQKEAPEASKTKKAPACPKVECTEKPAECPKTECPLKKEEGPVKAEGPKDGACPIAESPKDCPKECPQKGTCPKEYPKECPKECPKPEAPKTADCAEPKKDETVAPAPSLVTEAAQEVKETPKLDTSGTTAPQAEVPATPEVIAPTPPTTPAAIAEMPAETSALEAKPSVPETPPPTAEGGEAAGVEAPVPPPRKGPGAKKPKSKK